MDLTKKLLCLLLKPQLKSGSTTAQHPNINPYIHPSITVLPVAVDSLWPNSSLGGCVLVAVGLLWATLTQFFRCNILSAQILQGPYITIKYRACVCVCVRAMKGVQVFCQHKKKTIGDFVVRQRSFRNDFAQRDTSMEWVFEVWTKFLIPDCSQVINQPNSMSSSSSPHDNPKHR